ncbi:MAG TPA: cobalamin-dependent protein, partial [Minicystis sp.]|nr:cobalamin-dependent protein [Minicystis sp.]
MARASKTLLFMAPFWDPYCPPLGIASLQAFLRARGRDVAICDLNTDAAVWRLYREYLARFGDLVPRARGWNLPRLLPDYFARHQMAFQRLRHDGPRYRELVRRVLDVDGRSALEPGAFEPLDRVLEAIAARVDELALAKLREHAPSVVGCTLLTTTLPSALRVLELAKGLDPAVRTVLGGPGPIMGAGADSPDTWRLLERCPFVDNVVIGEGELLLDALVDGRVPKGEVVGLRDVARLTGGLVELKKPTRHGLVADLSTLPTPDFTGLDVRAYQKLSVGVSRGCAYDCAFCYETTYWKQYRKRPMSSALADVRALRERHGRTRF